MSMVEKPGAARATGVQVIARAADVLRAVRSRSGGLTLVELCDVLQLPRSTVHRILSALEQEELVVMSAGSRSRYRLGPEVTRLARAVNRDVVALLHPFLEELSHAVDETVDLSVLEASTVRFIDQVVAPHPLRAVSAVGESFPLHSCAPGKAILARLPPREMARLMPARLQSLTPHTLTSISDLREVIEHVRESGVAFDEEEQSIGICAVGVALDFEGLHLAVSIPLPTQRFQGRGPQLGTALLGLRERFSSTLT